MPELNEKFKQNWFCEKCHQHGSVEYEKHDGIWDVVQRIADSHKRVSPGCNQPVRDIRVEGGG